MNKKQLIFALLVVLLLSGCATLTEMNLLTPNAVTSEYFVTDNAGFLFDKQAKSVKYILGLKVLKEFNKGAFLEISFENPMDKNVPIVLTSDLLHNEKEVDIKSPNIKGLQGGHNYEIVVYIYTDASKKELLGRHRQLVQSLFDTKVIEKYTVTEPWVFTFDGRIWEIGNQWENIEEKQKVIEYVLNGESVENWSELVTSSQVVLSGQVTLDNYIETIQSMLSKDCPSLKWDILKRDGNNVILEWRHKGCHGFPPQDNISRITKVGNNIYMLSYVMKTEELSNDKREKWFSVIENAILR